MEEVPEHLICIGGGIIGLELGSVWAKLGSKVTVVELLPQVLTGVEKRMVNVLKKKMKKLGIRILTSSQATGLKKSKTLELTVETPDGEDSPRGAR